jgi:ABC-type glycerol-3-phosphate transport system substrate-binding protein
MPELNLERVTVEVGLESFLSTNDAVGIMLADKFGINLVPVDISAADTEALESYADSGALPDVTRVDITAPYFQHWIDEGIIREIPQNLIDKFPKVAEIAQNSDELAAVGKINGGGNWFIPVDASGFYGADSGRIYYRRDWLAETAAETTEADSEATPPTEAPSAPAPSIIEDFTLMISGFAEKNSGTPNASGLTLAGGVTYLISLFGTDPESWVFENGEWVPAYYSDRMVRGLSYVRRLYDAGVISRDFDITKANTAINHMAENLTGGLIRHGDAYWMQRVMDTFAERNGITAAEAYGNHIAILPPPAVPITVGEYERYWPRSVVTGGCVISAAVDDAELEIILGMLEYTLSDEGQEIAYFGLRGETCAETVSESGERALQLFIDPSTAQPFDITEKYPSAQLMFLLDANRSRLAEYDEYIPSPMHPAIKAACTEAARVYGESAIDEGDGFLIRFLRTPAKDGLRNAMDYSAAFNRIVMGAEPVEEMFAAFKRDCEQKNIRAAITEVNAFFSQISAE